MGCKDKASSSESPSTGATPSEAVEMGTAPAEEGAMAFVQGGCREYVATVGDGLAEIMAQVPEGAVPVSAACESMGPQVVECKVTVEGGTRRRAVCSVRPPIIVFTCSSECPGSAAGSGLWAGSWRLSTPRSVVL